MKRGWIKGLVQLLADNGLRAGIKPASRIVASADEATLYLYDAIVSTDAEAEWWGGVSAQTLVPQLREITANVVHVRVNSPGGDVFAAQAIAQALRDMPGKTVCHVDGYAASAATVIAASCTECQASAGAMLMIHKAWTMEVGNADTMRKCADLLDKVDGTLGDLYAKRTGKTPAECLDAMGEETWFTAEEALAFGLIDSIAADDESKREDQTDTTEARSRTWNLAAYERAPKVVRRAPEPSQAERLAALERGHLAAMHADRVRLLDHFNRIGA